MATYTLAEAPEFTVSVRGKDSPTTRQNALDKISEMLALGELPTEIPRSLSTEQLILTEAPAKALDVEDDGAQEPLESAVRELQKFLFLKIRTQRVKQVAVQVRHQIEALLTDESIEQEQDQLEEILKGSFKTLKEYVTALREYRSAKPGAEAALVILDEALQFKFSISTSPNARLDTSNQTNASEAFEDNARAETGTETATATNKNGKKNNPEHKI